ncbi:hypothetical protein HOG21_04555 [bacterium]|nr:hypothetical protein [bacterium]
MIQSASFDLFTEILSALYCPATSLTTHLITEFNFFSKYSTQYISSILLTSLFLGVNCTVISSPIFRFLSSSIVIAHLLNTHSSRLFSSLEV